MNDLCRRGHDRTLPGALSPRGRCQVCKRAIDAKYRRSEKRRATNAKYARSEKGRATEARRSARRTQSGRGLDATRRWRSNAILREPDIEVNVADIIEGALSELPIAVAKHQGLYS